MKAKTYIYFTHLSLNEQKLYREILPEISQGNTGITITTNCTSTEAFATVKAIHLDHPDFFWMDGSSNLETLGGIVKTLNPGYNRLHSNLSYNKKIFEKAVVSYLKECRGKTVIEAERVLHDLLVKNVSYVHTPDDQTAYSALVDGKSVCSGYSRAFQYLCQRLDIPCYYCHGQTQHDGEWGLHAWNIIGLKGDFYNIDITWDDCYDKQPGNRIGYTYYNCTDSDISVNHRRDSECVFLPKCTATKASFKNIYGISAEEELIHQDGITSEKSVTCKEDFFKAIYPSVKTNKKGRITISFPVSNKNVINNSDTWFQEIMRRPDTYRGSWQLSSLTTDYQNGWYKLQLDITLK